MLLRKLYKQYPDDVDIESSSWLKSIFQKKANKECFKAIKDRARKEIELYFFMILKVKI